MSSPRRQAALARAVLDSATDFAIVTTGLDGRITSWNPGAEHLLGWAADEMIGQSAERFFTPEDNAVGRAEHEMALARETGRAEDERWHLKKDGSCLWASGLMMRFEDDETGDHIGYLKILRDRTAQHEDRRRLEESEARWRGLFEQLQEGFVVGELVRDAEGHAIDWRYIDVNAAWSELVGVPAEAAIGRTVRELIPGVEDAWIGDVAAAFDSGQPVTFTRQVGSLGRWYDGRIHRLDGDRFTILFNEVTSRHLADRRRDAFLELGDRTRDELDPTAMTAIGAEIIGRALGVGRVGYGTLGPDGETFVVAQDWTAPGFPTLAGIYRMDDYGLYAENLRRGQTVCIPDTREDHRTAGSADTLDAISVRALINVPVQERGRTVAILYVNSDRPRRWSNGELAFVREVAERLRQTVERRIAEARLGASETELRIQREFLDTLIRQAPVGISISDAASGRLSVLNERARTLLGHDEMGEDASRYGQYGALHADGRPYAEADYPTIRVLRNGVTIEREEMIYRRGGPGGGRDADVRRLEVSSTPVRDGDGRVVAAVTIFFDVEEQRQASDLLRDMNEMLEDRVATEMAERAKTEEALRQSQKMEAVGQLTGGLAHDFNNLLTGITGSLEMMAIRIGQGRMGDVEKYNVAAQGAAKRAAALTHRLLAFSRRQTLDPKPTQPNRLIEGMLDLIGRTVGPEVEIRFVPGEALSATLVDPNQLENALLNLCINARDAMPEGGRLTIETSDRTLDARAARINDLDPGRYVALCVSDSGTGMPPEVIAKAFDPFFTTKPLGVGTGLGLSMIYGFARQSSGNVRIHSDVGAGTTVCIYLPRHLGEEEAEQDIADLAAAPRAEDGETVLVVDDEPSVRMLVTDVLEELGYTAIEAADGAGGLKVLQSDARIDLLVSDVGLPGGMNGRQMADAARVGRPDLKILFITGYAENAAVGNGQLEPGMHVMTKPFAMEALATRIRTLIEG